jgi:NADPH:quinone reductase-like Zn-dependent oxidoreductase
VKAWQIVERGGLDGLRLVDLPEPAPGQGEVLVRIRAISLNYRDLVATRIERPGALTPLIPCSDGAGEIVAVGEGVTKWQPGDQVVGCFFQGWDSGRITRDVMRTDLGGPRHGVLAEFVVLNANGVVAVPEHLSYQQAATLPCAALTAWHALVENGRLQAGDTVLALGTGGVSIFALQFAKLSGARVIITSSRDEKLERAKRLGADATINYHTYPDWSVRVHELTGKLGVDHVIEVGGSGTLEKSLESLRYGGHIHHIGVLTGFDGKINPWWITAKSATVRGVYVGSREMFESMNRAIALHQLEPVIDRVVPFAEAREAFSVMERALHFGKIVIDGVE